MEMLDLSELINEELYEQLPTSVLEFIDSGVTLTYLARYYRFRSSREACC